MSLRAKKLYFFIAVAAIVGGCGKFGNSNKHGLSGFGLRMETYKSCRALQGDIKERLEAKARNDKERQEFYQSGNIDSPQSSEMAQNVSAPSSADSKASSGAESSAAGSTFTNVQEKGVDESDYTKIGDAQIFVARSTGIEVIDRKSLKHIGVLAKKNSKTNSNSNMYGYSSVTVPTLYALKDRLLVLTQSSIKSEYCPTFKRKPQTKCEDGALGAGVGSPLSSTVVSTVVSTCQSIKPQCYKTTKPVTIVESYLSRAGKMPKLLSEKQ